MHVLRGVYGLRMCDGGVVVEILISGVVDVGEGLLEVGSVVAPPETSSCALSVAGAGESRCCSDAAGVVAVGNREIRGGGGNNERLKLCSREFARTERSRRTIMDSIIVSSSNAISFVRCSEKKSPFQK